MFNYVRMIPHTFPFHRVAATAFFFLSFLFFFVPISISHIRALFVLLLLLFFFFFLTPVVCYFYPHSLSVLLVSRGHSSMQKGGERGGWIGGGGYSDFVRDGEKEVSRKWVRPV